jgi:hypothetical protein
MFAGAVLVASAGAAAAGRPAKRSSPNAGLPSDRRARQELRRPRSERRGRKAGAYPGYNYSEANKNSGITWDEATLNVNLKNPQAKVPGTKMVFPGLSSDEDIANVIAYLKQFGPDSKKI